MQFMQESKRINKTRYSDNISLYHNDTTQDIKINKFESFLYH